MTKTEMKEKIEKELDYCYQIAKWTDEEMENKDKPIFLPNNPDFINYSAKIELLSLMGIATKKQIINNKVKHTITNI